MITHAIDTRGPGCDVENRLATAARPAPAESSDDRLNGQFVIQHGRKRKFLLPQKISERFRLRDRAGKTVEQKAAAATQATPPLADQVENCFVRHEITALHVTERFLHGGRTIALAEASRRAAGVQAATR